MPYKSDAQRRKFHQMANEGKMDPHMVDEWDKASEGMRLPERAPKKPRPTKRKKHAG